MFTKEKEVVPALTEAQNKLIDIRALTIVKKHLRAEARAQATVVKKELTDKFNVILEQVNRGQSNLRKDVQILADNNLRLTVMVAVLQDLLFAGRGHVDQKEFGKLCDIKKASYEVGARA